MLNGFCERLPRAPTSAAIRLQQRDWRSFASEERATLEHALRLAIAVHGEHSDKVAGIRRMVSIGLRSSGAYAEAIALMKLVAVHSEEKHGEGPVLASTLKELGAILHEQGDFEGARATYARAWAMAARRGTQWLDALLQLGLAEALLGLGRPAEALPFAAGAYNDLVDRYGERSARPVEVGAR